MPALRFTSRARRSRLALVLRIKELEAKAEEMDIRYSDLPNGAKIEYETNEPALVAALHAWFDAQLSDHGDHAEDGGSGTEGRPSDHEGHDDEQHSVEH